MLIMAWSLNEVNKEHAVTQFSVVITPTDVVEAGHRYSCEDNAHYWQYECDSQDDRRY